MNAMLAIIINGPPGPAVNIPISSGVLMTRFMVIAAMIRAMKARKMARNFFHRLGRVNNKPKHIASNMNDSAPSPEKPYDTMRPNIDVYSNHGRISAIKAKKKATSPITLYRSMFLRWRNKIIKFSR